MSKKKATMTLKDFHGGSIPSDLPLPSAPGVTPKVVTERPVFDRASSAWGNNSMIGRPRPSSSHTIRNFDDKSLFLPHSVNIGRNFNEDERKPLDGHSSPRRMVSDDVFRVANSRLEVKAESVGRPSGYGESLVSGSHVNAWSARKEVTVANETPWTTQPAVSSLVHPSVVEQGSSVRWQSKLLGPSSIGHDVVKHSEIESRGYKTNDSLVVNQRDEAYGTRVVERDPVAEYGILGGKKFPNEYEAKVVSNSSNKTHPNVGHLVQPAGPSEVVARPKLNLLPRTKPLEIVAEKTVNDAKLENGALNLVQRGTGYVTQKSMNNPKPGLSADEISNQPVERPKLYLKPEAQLLEQPEVTTEKERNAVFGGARPRELVLKERGIDETEHHKLEQPLLDRLDRMDLKPIERVPEHASQRPLSSPRDPRTRKFDPKDGRSVGDIGRTDTQRRNWRENDNKSSRQQQQQQTQEKTRHPSPETWRKPVLQKPESPDGTGIRHGKAAFALELAQAYSSSDPKSGIRSNIINTSRNNQTQQQPFSRLVGSATSRQINGY